MKNFLTDDARKGIFVLLLISLLAFVVEVINPSSSLRFVFTGLGFFLILLIIGINYFKNK